MCNGDNTARTGLHRNTSDRQHGHSGFNRAGIRSEVTNHRSFSI